MVQPPTPNSRFLAGVDGWARGLGRLRDVVRQELVARQLEDRLGQGGEGRALRVLDVGCGQGTQALRLARAGHEVTGLDISTELLALFEQSLASEPAAVRGRVRLVHGAGELAPDLVTGRFDLILCHGLLMYLDDDLPILRALTACAADGARLSLIVRNGLAMAMRAGLQGDWQGALAAFDTPLYVNRIGLSARAHTPADLEAELAPQGWRLDRWYGVRVFTDHHDGEADGGHIEALLAAEREAGERDPYRQVAGLLHVCFTRP